MIEDWNLLLKLKTRMTSFRIFLGEMGMNWSLMEVNDGKVGQKDRTDKK